MYEFSSRYFWLLLPYKIMSRGLKHCCAPGHLRNPHPSWLAVLGVIRYPLPPRSQTQRQPNCVSIRITSLPCHSHRRAQTILGSRDLSRSCPSAVLRWSGFLACFKRDLLLTSKIQRSHSFALSPPRADQEAYTEAEEILG